MPRATRNDLTGLDGDPVVSVPTVVMGPMDSFSLAVDLGDEDTMLTSTPLSVTVDTTALPALLITPLGPTAPVP